MKANYSNASQEVESVRAVKNCNVEVAGCVDTKDSWLEVRGEKTYLCLLMPLSGPSISEFMEFKHSRKKRCLLAKNVVEMMARLHDGNIFINGQIFTSLVYNWFTTYWLGSSATDFTSLNILIKVRDDVQTYTSDMMMATIKSKSENVSQVFTDEDGNQRYDQPVEPIPKRLYGNASFIKLVDVNLALEIIDVHQGKFI
jgi:hypothetical protein